MTNFVKMETNTEQECVMCGEPTVYWDWAHYREGKIKEYLCQRCLEVNQTIKDTK